MKYCCLFCLIWQNSNLLGNVGKNLGIAVLPFWENLCKDFPLCLHLILAKRTQSLWRCPKLPKIWYFKSQFRMSFCRSHFLRNSIFFTCWLLSSHARLCTFLYFKYYTHGRFVALHGNEIIVLGSSTGQCDWFPQDRRSCEDEGKWFYSYSDEIILIWSTVTCSDHVFTSVDNGTRKAETIPVQCVIIFIIQSETLWDLVHFIPISTKDVCSPVLVPELRSRII